MEANCHFHGSIIHFRGSIFYFHEPNNKWKYNLLSWILYYFRFVCNFIEINSKVKYCGSWQFEEGHYFPHIIRVEQSFFYQQHVPSLLLPYHIYSRASPPRHQEEGGRDNTACSMP